MVQAWYFDNNEGVDYREPHKSDKQVSLEELYKKTRVEYFKFDADLCDDCKDYAKLKKDRGYSYEDTIEVSRYKLPNYDEKMKRLDSSWVVEATLM